jgi:hypothetical protein
MAQEFVRNGGQWGESQASAWEGSVNEPAFFAYKIILSIGMNPTKLTHTLFQRLSKGAPCI